MGIRTSGFKAFIDEKILEGDQLDDKAKRKIYYQAHRERILSRMKKYDRTHPEEIKARNKVYREKNLEELLTYNRTYYKQHCKE